MVAVALPDCPLQREQFFCKSPEDFQCRILVVQEHIAPHRRVRGRDAGEVAETGCGILDDFTVGHAGQIVCHTNHRIGDQVRRVGCHGQHEIVVLRVHLVGIRTQRMPEVGQPCDLFPIGPLGRDKDAPAVVIKFRKARTRARVFGARQRVRWDEMYAVGQMRLDRRNDAQLGRADIAQHGTRFQRRRDFGHDAVHCTHRHAQYHQIGVAHCLGRGIADRAKVEFAGSIAGLGRPRIAGDLAHTTRPPGGKRDGRCDQPQTDQSDAVVDHRHHACPLNCDTAWTTRRQEASSPTVIRRHCGNP